MSSFSDDTSDYYSVDSNFYYSATFPDGGSDSYSVGSGFYYSDSSDNIDHVDSTPTDLPDALPERQEDGGSYIDEIQPVEPLPETDDGAHVGEIQLVEDDISEADMVDEGRARDAPMVAFSVAPITGATYRPPIQTLVTCWLTLFLGGIITGYASTAPGGVDAFPTFLVRLSKTAYRDTVKAYSSDFCIFVDPRLTAHSSLIPIGGTISVICAIFFGQHSRKHVILTGAVLVVVGASSSAWFPHVIVEVCGRILIGLGVGLFRQVIPIMCSQILPEDSRGSVDHIFEVSKMLGSLLAPLLNLIASYFPLWGWRMAIGSVALPAFFLILLYPFIEEPPQSYIQLGNLDKAKDVLRTIRGLDDVSAEFRDLHLSEGNRTKSPLTQILSRPNIPVLIIIIVSTFLMKVLGLDVMNFYAPFFLQSIGYERHVAYIASFIVTSIQIVAQLLGWFSIKFFGRQKNYFVASLALCLALVSFFLIFLFNENDYHHLSYDRATVAIPFLVIYISASGVLPGVPGWLDTTFPKDCAELGSACAIVWDFILSFTMNQCVFLLLCAAREWIFVAYATFAVLLAIFLLAFVPETAGVTEEDMDERVWSHHWCWRRVIVRRAYTSTA